MTSYSAYLLALAISATAGAQIPADHPSADIRVKSDLVLINAVVTDARGRPVTDLNISQFHVLDDGQEQVIKSCSRDDVPVSIGVVLDASGSMRGQVGFVKSAALQFIHAANPADEYFLLEFRNQPQVVVPFTTEPGRLLSPIEGMQAGGSTALFDAVHVAVKEMVHARYPRKALLIISDGMDNHSRYTERETNHLINEIDFPIYTIDIWQPQYGNRFAIQRRDTGVLETFSTPTGGRGVTVRDPKKLGSTMDLISTEIRDEYVLGYAPSTGESNGSFHKVRITVDSSPGERFTVSNRASYYIPTQ